METKIVRGQPSGRGDVHGYEGRFRIAWHLAVRDPPPEDLSLVGRFIDSCRAEGLSASRCTVYLFKLMGIRRSLGKGFSWADRSDVERVVAEIYGQ
jgi:hypothetical protein